MKNFLVFLLLFFILLGIGGLFIKYVKEEEVSNISSTKEVVVADNSSIYFWSSICPHCIKVQEFMDGWDKKDQFQITKIQVNQSKENSDLFVEASLGCDIPDEEKGSVPLLVTPEGNCLVGETSIIEHLKNLQL